MLEKIEFKSICRQMMLQSALTFLTRVVTAVMQSAEDFSPARMEQLLDDFREGFDRRLSLLVTNHMLCE